MLQKTILVISLLSFMGCSTQDDFIESSKDVNQFEISHINGKDTKSIYIYSGIPEYDIVDFKICDSLFFTKLCYECDTVISTILIGDVSFYLESNLSERIHISTQFSGTYWNITPKALGLVPITFDAQIIE